MALVQQKLVKAGVLRLGRLQAGVKARLVLGKGRVCVGGDDGFGREEMWPVVFQLSVPAGVERESRNGQLLDLGGGGGGTGREDIEEEAAAEEEEEEDGGQGGGGERRTAWDSDRTRWPGGGRRRR